MSSIKLANVTKYFQKQPALREVSFTIPSGQRVAIVGPSGSGKSTLLRLIAGLESVSSGTIYLEQAEANAIPPPQRHVSLLFQQNSLYPHLNVQDNINFAKPKDSSAQGWVERFEALSRWLEIDSLKKRMHHKSYGGEQQRVALVRALIRNQKIQLLDEPLSHLDRRLARLVQHKILEAQRKYAFTLLYVTHDLDEAFSFADRMIVLDSGTLIQADSLEETLKNPSPFVRSFLELETLCQSHGFYFDEPNQTRLTIDSLEFRLKTSTIEPSIREDKTSTTGKQDRYRAECRVRLLDWKANEGNK